MKTISFVIGKKILSLENILGQNTVEIRLDLQ